MGSRNVIVYLIIGMLSVAVGYDIYLNHHTQTLTNRYHKVVIDKQQDIIHQQQIAIKAHQKDAEFIKEHVEDIYKLFVLDAVRGYVTMDTLIRVFHYAKPHKSPVWNCPECADIRKKGLPNKQLPGERLTLPPNTGPERITHAISSSHKHGEDN